MTGFAENAAIGHGHLDPGTKVIAKPYIMDAFVQPVAEIIKG
ncbi:hypothetical protein [Mycobacterium sp.]